ncbi:MAG: hypothetical protein ACRCWI_03725 [Brevinema sp.]
MKKKSIFIFVVIIFLTNNVWGEEIWFKFPVNGQPVSGKLEIKVFPPPQDILIYVWIEDTRTKQLVWMGNASPQNDYITVVDTAKFRPGRYEINAEYYIDGREYEGDIIIWVNSP